MLIRLVYKDILKKKKIVGIFGACVFVFNESADCIIEFHWEMPNFLQ